MSEFLNIAIPGLFAGCVLALLGVGYGLIFNTTGIVNLAQGGFIILGALLSYSFNQDAKLNEAIAILLSVAVVTAIGAAMERLVLRRANGRLSAPNVLIVVAGVLLILDGVATVGWGATPVAAKPFLSTAAFHLGAVSIPTQGVLIGALTVVLLVGIWSLLGRSTVGKALRASAQSPFAARLVGVRVERMGLLSFAASAAIGAIAGAFFLPFTSVASTSIVNYSLLGLVVMALGGFGDLFGAVVGGLFLGVADALVTGYVSSVYGDVLSMAVLIGVLAFRPEGVLGRRRGRRTDAGARNIGLIPVTPSLPGRTGRRLLVFGVVVLMGVLPFTGLATGELGTLGLVGVMALSAVGLDLLSGTAGQVNLGQAGFMAVGGYTASLLMLREGVAPLVALLAAMAAAALVALGLSLVLRRVNGIYLAVVTLAFGLLVEDVVNGSGFLGGSGGLVGVPAFSVGGFSFDTPIRFYYLIWCLVAVATLIVVRINSSIWGRMTKLLHGSEIAASALGYDVGRGRLFALVAAAVLGAMSGVFYASDFHYLAPSMVGVTTSLLLITMVFVGGAGTAVGALIGASLFTFLPNIASGLTSWFDVLEGGLLVIVLSLLPSGLYGGFTVVVRRLVRVRVGRGMLSEDRGRIAPRDPEPSNRSASEQAVNVGGIND